MYKGVQRLSIAVRLFCFVPEERMIRTIPGAFPDADETKGKGGRVKEC